MEQSQDELFDPPTSLKLAPCITKLIWAGRPLAGTILRVERIHVVSAAQGTGAYQLVLSDGEWTISAVLAAELHAKVSSQELAESTVIELDSYELSSAPKLHGPGSIFYLAISAYHLPTHPRPSPLPREVESSLSPYALASLRDGQVLKPIRRPLDLLSLSALGLAHPAQNRLCDVVGIVAALAPRVVRAPIGVKREVFLVDPWAAKQWTLSVWVRPELCSVARGTVVLLRNVRNHRFGGGSLNAYRDDCEGWDWMLLNPVHVVGCRVEEMRRWWVGREGGEAG